MQQSLFSLSLLLASASAFPHMARQLMEQVEARAAELEKRDVSYTGFQTTTFNAAQQYVSNTGANAFIAPNFANGDQRGPCPGLNTAANHGYISRNGYTNLVEAIQGTNAVFGMGQDLGGFLSAYSVLQAGDPLTLQWSIGGPPTNQALLPVVQSPGNGLIGTHNDYETDSSPMRGDLYEYGNNYKLQLSQFQTFYDYHKGEANPNYSFDDLANFRKFRFTQSIENNPYFFYGPFTGVEVSQAAFTFISAFMSNHSAAYPNGFLSRDTLKSFMSITETGGTGVGDGTLTWTPGHEQIPNNWYKRAVSNPYTIPAFELDILRVAQVDPRILSIGGNFGKTNSYAGLSIANFTGDAYNLQTLSQGNNLQCFGYEVQQQLNPDVFKGLTSTLLSYLNPFNCPQLATIDQAQLSQFPGYKKETL